MSMLGKVARRLYRFPAHLKQQAYFKFTLPLSLKKIDAFWSPVTKEKFDSLKTATLQYTALNNKPDIHCGAYSYKLGGKPLLYASCYAALTRDLYGDLEPLPPSQKQIWIAYINSFQGDDGLFRDSLIECKLADEIDWWGWRHMTLHACMALTALGGVASKQFALLNQFKNKGSISDWLESRSWDKDPSCVSNEIQNIGTFLQYSRDFHAQPWCRDVLKELFAWLDKQQDPKTGLWGTSFESPSQLSNGVQTGYHLWCLYFYDKRPIRYIEKVIDSCLATQNKLGGYGVQLNSSACEDIDSIDPLVRLYCITDYRKNDIEASVQRAFNWVMVNANADGGWVFRRNQKFKYGHDLMTIDNNESGMFPTWFRTLSLAYIGKLPLAHQKEMSTFNLLRCPGHQFWLSP